MIDRATVERIKATADIVDVVGDYVHLIRRGANYMGLCPFHNERTPSFSVNRQRNFCYCFSCKKGGSPVNFIMEKEGLSYHEALLHLARKYGIEVVERELTDEEREQQSLREAMYVANEWAMKKMESDMSGTEEGRDIGLQYFSGRGVTDAAIKAFHLGYALDNGHELTDSARKAGFRIDVLKALGLVGTSKTGHDYDRFRGRVIFPILNTAGRVIAFGGRDLKGGLAKYINSPESELYKKSNELYGIFQAKSSIVSEDKCFLVEGYMDVIGMWQSGMKNVVASSGTALTDGQIAMIHRFTENITLIYDGDKAGIKASLRGIDMLLSHKLKVKVLLLPDGDDPDSFARKHTPEEFKSYVEAHETDIIRYKAQVMLNAVKKDPQNRIAAINSVVESIAHIPDPVSRDVYVQECSMILGIPDTTVARSVAKAREVLVEKMKKERQLKAFPNQPAPSLAPAVNKEQRHSAGIPAQPEQSVDKAPQPDAQASGESGRAGMNDKPEPDAGSSGASGRSGLNQFVRHEDLSRAYPLYPLEREVMKYCVRYAFLPFCSYETENEQADNPPVLIQMNVMEFIKDELAQAEMNFTVPIFREIFRIIEEMTSDIQSYMEEKGKELNAKYETRRKEGQRLIGESEMSVPEIERAEQTLENEIEAELQKETVGLLKDYPSRMLCSHEDENVRKIAMELTFERHHLSKIYLKSGGTELEEDKLTVLLVRAIDEWKNELINLRMNELLKRFGEIKGSDIEEVRKIQAELESLLALRKEMGKILGERSVANRRPV